MGLPGVGGGGGGRDVVSACALEPLTQGGYPPDGMFRRTGYMVAHSALVIAVYGGAGGGTRRTLEYAIRRGVSFVDIRPEA